MDALSPVTLKIHKHTCRTRDVARMCLWYWRSRTAEILERRRTAVLFCLREDVTEEEIVEDLRPIFRQRKPEVD